jgi:hypothetical protein
MWKVFKAHVRRGGYASELKDPNVARELEKYTLALRQGTAMELQFRRPYLSVIGSEWWANLKD